VSIDEIPLRTRAGRLTTLAPYAGQVRLIVNLASRRGRAPQHVKLESLQRRYGHRGFTVLGFPSNQFFESSDDAPSILDFCPFTDAATYPVFAKLKVNGAGQHPLYAELTKTPDAAGRAGRVQWNFEKFLLTPSGGVRRFRPRTPPDDPAIIDLIEASLPVST
jgi:glutathione peroxidase